MAVEPSSTSDDEAVSSLAIDDLKSLAVLQQDRERPYSFLTASQLKIDALALVIPWREGLPQAGIAQHGPAAEDAITAVRLAVAAAVRDGLDALARVRAEEEARASLRELLGPLRARLAPLDRREAVSPEFASLLLEANLVSQRFRKGKDVQFGSHPGQAALDPNAPLTFLAALDDLHEWLCAAERVTTRKPGTFGRIQEKAFVASLAWWWKRATGRFPPTTRPAHRPGVTEFFTFLDAARQDAGLRGQGLDRLVRDVVEDLLDQLVWTVVGKIEEDQIGREPAAKKSVAQ